MIPRSLLSLTALVVALWQATPAQANYLWLQRSADDAEAIAVRAGELHQPLAGLPALRDTRAVVADGKDGKSVPLLERGDRLQVSGAGSGDVRVSAVLPGEEGVLTFHQARHGRAETRAVNDLELVPTEPGGNTFKLMWKATAVAAGQVNVDTAAGWRRVLRPAKDGTVTLETPFPGLYVLEVTARVDGGSVTLDGRKYDDVRHTATLSFEVSR